MEKMKKSGFPLFDYEYVQKVYRYACFNYLLWITLSSTNLKFNNMALIYCSDCGHQVSDKAPTCPNCGAPIAVATPVETEIPKQEVTEEKSGGGALVVLGYVFSAISLLFLPFLFGLLGLIFAIINMARGDAGHGAVQLILSIISIIWAFVAYGEYVSYFI